MGNWSICALFGIFLVVGSAQAGSPYSDPHFADTRTVITHLMQWKFEDIAAECERFLGPNGYGGVQVSPVTEHEVLDRRPWNELYQPVSYKIETRSGNEAQFRNMVERCNRAGVRIYVDVVLNHLSGPREGIGSGGSHYNGNAQNYSGYTIFTPVDFNGKDQCHTADLEIHNFDNPEEARNCRLNGLRDLKQSSEYVRIKQSEFLNKLIDMGVAGFRCDRSKHMWPADLENIFSRLHNLNTAFFKPNSRPFIYHEVIYYGGGGGIKSSEYTRIGRAIEFNYYRDIANVFRGHQEARNLTNFGQPWGMLPSEDALVMVDSHDLQRYHTGQLGVNLNYFEPKLLRLATAFMLAWGYGVPRVMSSYQWPQKVEGGKDINDWYGPPTDGSGNIIPVRPAPDQTCNKEWICEHRWRQIYRMVQFRNSAGSAPVEHWWDNGNGEIAFSRANKAFVVFNLQKDTDLYNHFQTGLPAGTYCDVITGIRDGGRCTGTSVAVDEWGEATVLIDSKAEDPFVAIHVGAKL